MIYPELWGLGVDIAGPHPFLNAAAAGDRTEHAIGRLDLLSPFSRLVAIQIGTNNHHFNDSPPKPQDPAETAEGIAHLVAATRARAPEAKIVLIAIPPSSRALKQERGRAATRIFSTLADGERILFLDPGHLLDMEDPGHSNDGVHFMPRGAALWYGALAPTLRGILDETAPPPADENPGK
jgi:lysophospholipase L1-like esterase